MAPHRSLRDCSFGCMLLCFWMSNSIALLIVVGLSRVSRLHVWYPRKLTLLTISRSGMTQGFEIVDLIFFCTNMHHEYFFTHWCRVTHTCVTKLTIIDSDMACRLDGTKPWSEPMLKHLLIWPLGTNFSKILIEIYTFSVRKMHLKTSSGNIGHFVSDSMSWICFRVSQFC